MHPLTQSYGDLTDEELQQRISKLLTVQRMARDPNVWKQAAMILDDLNAEQQKRHAKYLEQLANKNKKNLSDIIDIK